MGSIAEIDHQIEVTFEGPGKFGHERFDRVLVSVGRRPVTQGLGLENTAAQVNQRGFVVCDKQQRTTDPHIFAIGDVAGDPMLAHKASHEAKVAIEVILGRNVTFDKAAIPAVVAIEMGCEVRDITESIHPHPTLSETLMNAGEVHFGTATEIYKPKKH